MPTPRREFDLIEQSFRQRVTSLHPTTRIANGDDASVHHLPDGMELVFSTDTSLAGVHWPEDMPLVPAADRAVCAALSDMAAMGAEAAWVWLNVLARSPEDADAMGEGAARALNHYRLELAGGDTTRAPVNALAVSVGGLLPEGSAMGRDGARVGDEVWLCGRTGHVAFGLYQWLEGQRTGPFVAAFTHIEPQLLAGERLRGLGVRCCIDVSDGLVQDAGHIAERSRVALHLRIGDLPGGEALIAAAGEKMARQCMLHGGEDYALLFTAPPELRSVLLEFAVPVGGCREGEGVHLWDGEHEIEIIGRGFDHFG